MAAPKKPRNSRKTALKVAPAAPLPAAPLPAKRPASSSLSPYPDLSMAIKMLQNRAKNLSEDSTRGPLVTKWVEQLTTMQAEMQKLHKLEIFANRLISPK